MTIPESPRLSSNPLGPGNFNIDGTDVTRPTAPTGPTGDTPKNQNIPRPKPDELRTAFLNLVKANPLPDKDFFNLNQDVPQELQSEVQFKIDDFESMSNAQQWLSLVQHCKDNNWLPDFFKEKNTEDEYRSTKELLTIVDDLQTSPKYKRNSNPNGAQEIGSLKGSKVSVDLEKFLLRRPKDNQENVKISRILGGFRPGWENSQPQSYSDSNENILENDPSSLDQNNVSENKHDDHEKSDEKNNNVNRKHINENGIGRTEEVRLNQIVKDKFEHWQQLNNLNGDESDDPDNDNEDWLNNDKSKSINPENAKSKTVLSNNIKDIEVTSKQEQEKKERGERLRKAKSSLNDFLMNRKNPKPTVPVLGKTELNALTDQTSPQSVQPPRSPIDKKQTLSDDTTNENSQKEIQLHLIENQPLNKMSLESIDYDVNLDMDYVSVTIQPVYSETEGFDDTISSLNERARGNSVQPPSQALFAASALFHDLPSTVPPQVQDDYYTKNLRSIEEKNPQLFKEIIVGLNFHNNSAVRTIAANYLASIYAEYPDGCANLCAQYIALLGKQPPSPVVAAIGFSHGGPLIEDQLAKWDAGKLEDLRRDLGEGQDKPPVGKEDNGGKGAPLDNPTFVDKLLSVDRKITSTELRSSTPKQESDDIKRYRGEFRIDIDGDQKRFRQQEVEHRNRCEKEPNSEIMDVFSVSDSNDGDYFTVVLHNGVKHVLTEGSKEFDTSLRTKLSDDGNLILHKLSPITRGMNGGITPFLFLEYLYSKDSSQFSDVQNEKPVEDFVEDYNNMSEEDLAYAVRRKRVLLLENVANTRPSPHQFV